MIDEFEIIKVILFYKLYNITHIIWDQLTYYRYQRQFQITTITNYLGQWVSPTYSSGEFRCMSGDKTGFTMAQLFSSWLNDAWGHWKSDGHRYKKHMETINTGP